MKPSSVLAAANFLSTVVLASKSTVSNETCEAAPNAFSPSSSSPCNALLEVGLGDRLLLPGDDGYEPQIETWWALNARLRPWCLVLPQTTAEVSKVLQHLTQISAGAGDWHIAIRSGGHSLSGTNSIANGVVIDLSLLNSTTYDGDKNLASLGAGARWASVYRSLYEQGVTVVGGRDGGVGVGGFLLGGGYSFYTGRMGFGCDNVVNYEIVLADGQVISANREEHADLFKALKGGSSNFGIVTRFDVVAFAARNMSYELRVMDAEHSESLLAVVSDFAEHDISRGEDALVTFFQHNTKVSNSTSMYAIMANTLGRENSSSFDPIRQIPAISDQRSLTSLADAAEGSRIPPGLQVTWYTLTFKNNPKVLKRCKELHQELVDALIISFGADKFTTWNFLQPLPSYFGDFGPATGGNVMGLDTMTENGVLWTGTIQLELDEPALAVTHARLGEMAAQLREYATTLDANLPLVYLNYADASQDPLGSYGKLNVQHIRRVAAKYDPTGVFQTRVPGGFKISRVL